MKPLLASALALVALLYAAPHASAADGPSLGEVRAIAVAPKSADAVNQLHHEGWIEARGQVLTVSAFPDLFKVVGRQWTVDTVAAEQFAIPDLSDRAHREAQADNPYWDHLGSAENISSGRQPERFSRYSPISYWIFAGRDVSSFATPSSVSSRR